MDDRLKWLETRISSSLRPRNEELKNMFLNDENRLAFYEFINNEDVRRMFVYIRPPKQLIASLQPPHDLKYKSIFFLKSNTGTKITKDNIMDEVFYIDCTNVPLEHLELVVREVYLPLMCTNQSVMSSTGGDKVLDVLHRLMSSVEITQGHVEGRIILSLPSIEVLAEAAAAPNRRGAVLHVLETTVLGWIKQIKGVLRHDPIQDLFQHFGPEPGPLDEIRMWERQLGRLHSILRQLESAVAKDILNNLEQAQSQYAHSFSHVRKDVNKAVRETNRILSFLSTMRWLLNELHSAVEPLEMLRLFKPLMQVLFLVWSNSTYYHQMDKFQNILRLLSNEVVHRAIALVGEDILREPLESYSKLKEALRVCAGFRGTYLDFKDKADDQNARNIAENAERLASRPQAGTIFLTKMYGPHSFTPRYGLRHSDKDSSNGSLNEDELWTDSPWPPRNAPCFDLLNAFMERCNDVLELVETTRHFRLLAGAAEIGGAGNMSLDALVKEIHEKYTQSMADFFAVVNNVLSIDGSQNFERAFFQFRTIVKSLEKRLAEILRLAYNQCPTVEAQLRLLEVFEGVSGRELVQTHLEDKDRALVLAFNGELNDVRQMYATGHLDPPPHANMPPIVSKLMWIHALKERISRPMEKMKRVSPHSLDGDAGWQMKTNYQEVYKELEEYEGIVTQEWQRNITEELTLRLKQPLLIAEEYDEDIEVRPQVVHVNLDPQLLLLLKETHYLRQEPFSIKLPESAKELLRNSNPFELRVTATRLETIVSKYNTIMRTMTQFEKPLFERKLSKIDILFEQGLQEFTWKMKESADFIEQAMALVCVDVHQNLDIVQTNSHEIAEITISWSKGTLDVFSGRDAGMSYSMEELLGMQARLTDEHESHVVPSGNKIHALVLNSFEAVQISQASPAWQDFIDYIDAIVLDGLKQATLTSLKTMLNNLVQANMAEDDDSLIPILTIRLELIDHRVAFRPPLDQTTSVISVQELVLQWLDGFLARGRLVKMLGPKGTYQDYISADEEVKQLLIDINKLVEENSEECKKLLEIFSDYAFLWLQDVNITFEEFLRGNLTPNPLRSPNRALAGSIRQQMAERSRSASRASTASSVRSAAAMGTAERTFLTPKHAQANMPSNVPSLDEFDAEIEIYRTARDEIQSLEDFHNVGWLRVDLQPIKQVLTTYAAKWMWTFTKYLSDQVTHMLERLDDFLKRIEPEIESITGEERDTASFMKMMRLFNEVSAQQSEMDGKFAAMHRTVLLLKKYGQKLPDKTQQLFNAAPSRWNNLKTKVSLAKQRLGPRIQEESVRITQDLEAFGRRVIAISKELENSEVYNRECLIDDAWNKIDSFSKRLTVLENEAQDLIELQELLEASVVDFNTLPTCRHELNNLKQVWETVRVIDDQQDEWKRNRWQKMNTKFLREETNKQLEIVRGLPEDVFTWDIYMGLHESITNIQACLPLIDDLSNPAMRTRHWKQLVRVTGEVVQIDNDTLKRMTLGELLSLGLQQHVDDVRAIVQRAVKDLSIEQSLKNYEEVWLSKVFKFQVHIRSKIENSGDVTVHDNQSEVSQSEAEGQGHRAAPSRSQARTTSRVSNQSSHSKNKRSSMASLPASLLNLGDETGHHVLLAYTDPIFEELEGHQVTLQALQGNTAAGNFVDEVVKWQKRLQTIEAVLSTWLEVQEKWVELEEVYSSADVRTALPHDANRFAVANRDFKLLMRATEKNPNVLQCCSRKNILTILEHMNHSLEHCRKSLLNHLERRRQIFPRFYFLSMEDVLHIVCNGYDLSQVNMYISKLFENIGSLIYEEAEDYERCNFIITGVNSALGERLDFQQPVACDGQIETWLTSFLQGLKGALQFQMATAMGVEKPTQKTRTIRSAGSRKVTVPVQESKSATRRGRNSRTGSLGGSLAGSLDSKGLPKAKEPRDTSRPASVAEQLFANDPDADPRRSWTLDHVTEIVYLATHVQMLEQVETALQEFGQGKDEPLRGVLKKINDSIKATTILLKGMEGDKEKKAKKKKKKDGESDLLEDTNSLAGAGTGVRSSNAPSLGASRKDSMFDIAGLDTTHSPIPEEGGPGNESLIEPTTMEPIDTMNLAAMSMPTMKKEGELAALEVEAAAAKLEVSEMRLMLFPSQIHKLSCLLALLAHLRDYVEMLLSLESPSPITSLEWRSHLQYRFNKETRAVKIKCLDVDMEYGYEYLGSSSREVITPLTERSFVALMQAVNSYMGTLCVGPIDCGKFELVQELSHSFGHAMYKFNCTKSIDYCGLQDIFRGMASTGCWVTFNNLNCLDPSVLSVFAQLMTTVMEALRAGKAAVHLQADDIQLNSLGACFALVDSSMPVMATNPDKLMIFPSVTATLPDYVISQFRVVSVARPDLRMCLEVMLFSQGFINGTELAEKTMVLKELSCKLLGTNTFITENLSLEKAWTGVDISAGFNGWSLKTLKGVVAEAGAHLEQLNSEMSEDGDTDQTNDGDDEEEDEEEQEVEKNNSEPAEKILEGGKTLMLEEKSLVMALRDTFLPRMVGRDASVFTTLVMDVWPHVDIPMVFGGNDDGMDKLPEINSRVSSKSSSRIRTAKSQSSTKSVKDINDQNLSDKKRKSVLHDSINLNTPVVNMTTADRFTYVDPNQKQILEDIQDAIAVATGDLGLLPGVAFQARVAQLAQLNSAHQTIFVVGPAGCGKSECIKTFAVAERERGKTISVQTVFSKAVESEELMGYFDPKTKEWKDGLFASLLRKFCVQPPNNNYSTKVKPVMKIMQLDGEADPGQLELLHTVLMNCGSVVLGNNERITVPDTLRFIWELETLSNISPALLSSVGVLVMSANDVGWQLMLVQWLERRPDVDKDLLTGFCDVYIYKTINYLNECTKPHMFTSPKSAIPQYKRVIHHTVENMVQTFTNLLDTMVHPFPDLSDVEFERYFNFACIWAFAGTLEVKHRESFSHWWRESFEEHIDFPEEGMVFDYMVDSESHEFVLWSDIIPTYSATPHIGIPSDAFVHSPQIEQVLTLLGLLTDAGKSVLLVGENGCGKTAIVNERIRTVCSGEVAEVLSLTVQANRFTNAKLLYERLDERLEWKHGRTYVPKGNKRLLCFVDDVNLSMVDKWGDQTAIELIREHIDDGGFYHQESHVWRYVKSVTYVSTINPNTTANSPRMNQRFLRHFAVFGVPFPSNSELQTVFTTLTHTHFITPETAQGTLGTHHSNYDEKLIFPRSKFVKISHRAVIRQQENEERMKKLLSMIVQVTTELQERLRAMFLSTAQRCHYIFTIKDLSCIFKNLCLSLQPGALKKNLLLLWQHECYWVYGHRMVNEVDFKRFRQAFNVSVKKEFADDETVQTMIRTRQPQFSNLIEQDSGIVTAGMIDTRHSTKVSEADAKTDLFRPFYNLSEVKDLMTKGVEEYNKIHPRIKLSLYKVVVDQVCRLARTIASPHENAHCVLVAEGSPGQSTVITKLAAHLCGYTVYQINPSPLGSSTEYKMDQFKADLVQGYTRAGAKGEKMLLLLHEEELLEEDFLVFLIEFITGGAISHLFQYEEQTTIINSIRTEVTQAGLTYTRDVAWNFFLKTVRNNFRVCLIAGDGGTNFQRRCREYPAFTKSVNFIWFPHWSKTQLVEHAMYHLSAVTWMTDIQRENVAHMLASMHLVLRQQDGQERDSGEYRHVTNTSYEKFVERFISTASLRHKTIEKDHDAVATSLQQIRRENEVATKLRKNLEHEMTVLEERKQGTVKILSQIGQDTAITEQQIKVVRAQMDKISKLKKSLPEYQVAHERAVYKAIAIVADTKKVVQNINIDKLHELRAMQKPIIDIEDLMAAIIMILKSPSADLTWQKGAKRQMANIERFIEELMSFDDNQLPESTLSLVEPYLKKPTFEPDTLERKTSNSACGSLCKCVRGVVRYHRMMISKVKPLHQKVDETTQAVDDAEHKMSTLENKRKNLEVRLAGLAKGFEEATIDKNEQEEKTIKMKKMLETAGQLRKILKGERLRCQQIFDSHGRRLVSIPGGCAMASSFATYLGPYHHSFRRTMLTVHWPNCLRERGIPLVIDSIDGLKGRVIDWSIDFLKTASGASEVYDVDYTAALLAEDQAKKAKDLGDIVEEGEHPEMPEGGAETERTEAGEQATPRQEPKKADNQEDGVDSPVLEERPVSQDGVAPPQGQEGFPREGDEDSQSQFTTSSGPMLTSTQYNKYIKSLIKILIGEALLNTWHKQDFGPRQIENAAILCSSWQRPPMLIDPNNEGADWLGRLNSVMNNRKLVSLDMETRSDPHMILTLEKAIMRGKPVLLRNCQEHIDNIITPLMHHRNTANEDDKNEEPRMIKFCGRRILCHQDFRFYLSTPLPKPKFNPEIASTTTIINFGVSHDTLTEDLLSRAFARIRPDLYKERILGLRNVEVEQKTLHHLSVTVRDKVLTNQEAIMGSAKAVKFITDFTNAKVDLSNRLQEMLALIEDLDALKDELYPLARRAAMLYAICRSLQSVHNEYQFSLAYFLALFDEAVGGELPAEFNQGTVADDAYEDDDDESSSAADRKGRVGSTSSHGSREDTGEKATDKQTSGTKPEGPATVDLEEGSKLGQTEESVSTGAARKLIAGTESEELPALELPQTAPLPSEGVEYSNFSANTIKQLMDKLTGLVYRRIRESLYEEDCLLFATLLCLNIQAEGGENFTSEEMSLLLQGNPGLGMQLTLADFDCKDEPPDWMPQEKWEDILALSVLPGPLDSLCVNFAMNSDAWKAWYKADYPEREPLPLSLTGAGTSVEMRPGSTESTRSEKDHSKSPDLGPMTEFHQLLLLRMLRPDRLPIAMAKYINKYLTLNLPDQIEFNLQDMLKDSKRHLGVLLLLPARMDQPSANPVNRLRLTHPPVEVLLKLAKRFGVDVEHALIGEGSEVLVEEAIDTADKKDGWVVIQGLHLAPEKFFHQLKKHLVRVYRSREKLRASNAEEKAKTSKFCVWITSEPCLRIPNFLLLNLHKVAWNHITMDVTQPDMAEATTENTGEGSEPPLAINYKSPGTFLHSAIVTTMKQVPAKVWEAVLSETQGIRNIAFAVAIIQAMLVGRQLFGAQGLTQYYPFSGVQTGQAISLVLSRLLRPADDATGEPDKQKLTQLISQVVYENTAYSEFDRDYVIALVRNVLHNIYTDSSGTLVLGTVAVPTPPANVEPSEYAWWYEKNVDEDFTLAALQLHTSVEREACVASSTQFIQHMDQMFETQNMEAGDIATSQAHVVNVKRLRSALDICVEELPPLLELGQVPDIATTRDYDFPYHRPSVISIATASSTMMPETLGYVLLQECLWLNSLLCHIRQQISQLQEQLLSGPEALPRDHMTSVLSLQEEHVPVSWIHPNSQPSTHSLVSWLQDIAKRYSQLQTFVKCGMVPTYTDNGITENPVIGHGRLNKLWLGGLVNPEAMLTALRQEKAVVSQCSIEDIVFECVVLDTDNTAEYDVDEGGMFITNVHLQGAAWDYDNDCLMDATGSLFAIPSIYLKPVLRTESPDPQTQENRSKKIYNCPVYMNRSRQYKITELQLNCPPPVDTWYLARVALVLDAGLPEDGVRKSRSYLLNLRQPALMAEESEGESEEADEELEELEPDEESDTEEIGHSEPSQLSYRPMSPKAPPLPPGLGLLRERHMEEDEPESAKTKGGKKTPTRKTPSQTPTKTTPRKTPSLPAFNENGNAKQKTPSPGPGKKTPSPKAGSPQGQERSAPSPGGRLSKQGSKGQVFRGSNKEVNVSQEEEPRAFSQAHEDPVTQVEVEADADTDQR
ncbi:uncharacterized protein LOC127863384 isoform X2 [Dreissena polymorpha]|uniref:uncharacterized protein LOC127863384 isoform X2 n=1 Tax=Dreissena polymorpha TaxID=45954 RepID=UPI002265603E|nr:uncharacterized protein LOC127863384 isoform X2 [Dreissena polymorpha]